MANCVVLLNSGDNLLLNTGDKVLLNDDSCTADGGLEISGTHAVQRLASKSQFVKYRNVKFRFKLVARTLPKRIKFKSLKIESKLNPNGIYSFKLKHIFNLPIPDLREPLKRLAKKNLMTTIISEVFDDRDLTLRLAANYLMDKLWKKK